MKTTIRAKIVIDTDKYGDVCGFVEGETLTLEKIKKEIDTGKFKIEWINSELNNEPEPTLIIKF